MKGETGPLYLERVCDSEGEPTGYSRMAGARLLGNADQEAAYAHLPERFRFKEAERVYGKTSDPTRKFLLKCIGAGILEQSSRGTYCKVIPIEKIERVENNPEGQVVRAVSSHAALYSIEK